MENSFVKYEPSKGQKSENYYLDIENGINNFIHCVKSAPYTIISESESRGAGVHIEASYLCHGIWTKIMNNKYNGGRPQSGNSFYWCEDGNKSILFHFDIMNNPKKKSCGLANECSEAAREEWEQMYHSIGNMAPIPWFKVDGNHYIDSQQLHKSLDERWDLYLKFLQFSWENFVDNDIMEFDKYMKLTCQQMYFKEIYDEIKEINIDKISYEIIESWNQKINKNSELVSFSKLGKDAVIEIIKLIRLRCKIINILLEHM